MSSGLRCVEKKYQLHTLSYDWMEPSNINYFDSFEEAQKQLERYQTRLKVKQWRIYLVELVSEGREK